MTFLGWNYWPTLLRNTYLSNNTALTDLSCSSNQLTSLDISSNTALTGLSCSSNQLTSLDISNNTALTGLYCYNNPITSLDVSMCHDLSNLSCVNWSYNSSSGYVFDLDTKCPLESLKIYKYHILSDASVASLEEVYGDIIEYVE